MRIAFVTTSDRDALHDDDDLPAHIEAFEAAGTELVHAAWEDRSVDWDAFDLVVIRSPWNYVDRLEDFREWLEAHRAARNLHNPVSLVEWNMDKRYLSELSERGVPIVPTMFVDSIGAFAAAQESWDESEIVVKPTVSAGSRLTGRFESGDPGAEALVRRILARGFSVMVQPFAPRVELEGEIGSVYFDGSFSHSFRKGPLLAPNGALLGGEYREVISAAEAPADVRELVEQASLASTGLARERGWIGGSDQLLYARFDVIRLDDESPVLLEAELFEPSFFLPIAEGAAERFLEAVKQRVR